MEPKPVQYQVARKGKVMGVYSLSGLVEQLDKRLITLEDHYWTEGMADWLPLSNMVEEISRVRENLVEAQRREREATGEKAVAEIATLINRKKAEDDARRELNRQQHAAAAASKAAQLSEQAWKCHTCSNVFWHKGTKQSFGVASGIGAAIGMTVAAVILLAGFFTANPPIKEPLVGFLLILICAALLLAAIGSVIAFGVESGLQQFHSYHPRCPKCSSGTCSKQGG